MYVLTMNGKYLIVDANNIIEHFLFGSKLNF